LRTHQHVQIILSATLNARRTADPKDGTLKNGTVVRVRRRYFVRGNALRPGRVTAIHGIVFQSDGRSTIGRLFIRPFEALDRWVVGILPRPREPSLAMHAGIHVEIEGRGEYVAEQLVGSWYMDLHNGLNWTPIEDFRKRDRGGWDVTVPASGFRSVDATVVQETVDRLSQIEGHPFIGEDCTAFIERSFGERRLFADSPLLRGIGIGVRVGDPALPLLRADTPIDRRTRDLLQFDTIKNLPDALADVDAPNVRLWAHRLLPLATVAVPAAAAVVYSSASRRSTPVSSTARKFLR
jgi:hypothetical protein